MLNKKILLVFLFLIISIKIVSANDGARTAIGVNIVQDAPYNLNGTNIVVGVFDKGWINNTHDDLEGRVILAGSSAINDYHPTIVVGALAGNGNRSEVEGGTSRQWRGMAPNASIISYTYKTSPSDLYNLYNDAINNYNIDISSNSWGGAEENEYHQGCKAIDNITRGSQGKRVYIVHSSGNDGEDGWKSLLNFATAKNVISVGGTNSDDDSLWLGTGNCYDKCGSSKGPTDDGRIKPDIMAPACQNASFFEENGYGGGGKPSCKESPNTSIWSLNWTANNYIGGCGTSMAAPIVSGGLALMLEYWRQNYDIDPLPSTMKAILMHTAKDLGNTGPDFTYGYGRINISDAVKLIETDLDENRIIESHISKLNYKEQYQISLPSGLSKLKLTLVWDDYPGTPGAAKILVNDLDLGLIAPNNTIYYPWTLDNNTPENAAVRNQSDHLNNVEQVEIDNPESGNWTINITNSSSLKCSQDFSLISSYKIFDPESRIRNDETTNTLIYLLMKVQFWNGTGWEDEAVVYYNQSPIQIEPGLDNQLDLSTLWNPNSWNTSTNTHGNGTYRAYVAATDENNNILQNRDGTEVLSTYNFSLSISADNTPTITLISPTDNYNSTSSSITFNCSATDDNNLVNITLYGNWCGGWHANETKSLSGTSDSEIFTKTLTEDVYIWNCLSYDNASQSDWGDTNYTINVSIMPDTDYPYFTNFNVNESVIEENEFARFSIDIFDASSDISYANGTIKGTTYNFIDSGSNEWYYDWQCTANNSNVDFTWIGANDTANNWNETSITGVSVNCNITSNFAVSYILGYGGNIASSENYNITYSLIEQPVENKSNENYTIQLGWPYYFE